MSFFGEFGYRNMSPKLVNKTDFRTPEEKKAARRAYMKQMRETHKLFGECERCERKVVGENTLCEVHREARRVQTAARRAKLKRDKNK